MTDVRLHPRVLELVASRICHDLVSPVGAIANGLELMEELGEAGEADSLKLISNSTVEASIRLKCFRLCYGAAGSDRNVGLDEIKEIFQDWLKAGRIKLDWQPLKLENMPKGYAKTLLNLLILVEECAHGDGAMRVSASADGRGIEVNLTGKNPAFRDKAENALADKVAIDDLDPRLVHSYITGRLAKHFDLSLNYKSGQEPPSMAFVLSF